jgi:hypothetical protein
LIFEKLVKLYILQVAGYQAGAGTVFTIPHSVLIALWDDCRSSLLFLPRLDTGAPSSYDW